MSAKPRKLKWEREFWFLPNTEEQNEQNAQYYDDYILHSKRCKKAIMVGNSGPMNLLDYNVWVGHTDFKLNKQEVDGILKTIEGVDTYTIMSPYRIQIIIGRLFNGVAVRQEVKEKLCKKQVDERKFFVIIKKEDGKVETRKSDNKQELLDGISPKEKLIKQSWE